MANGNGVGGEPNRVWINDGAGNYTAGQSLGNSASFSVALGDIEGDGDLDAVVGNISGHIETVWLGNGDGTFSPSAFDFGELGTVQSVALSDLDGDGDLDAVFGTFGNGTEVWANHGDGTFVDTGHSVSGVNFTVLADIDGDNDQDMFVARRAFAANHVFKNNGSGGFTDTGQALGLYNSWGAALGDLDDDGDVDAFVANAGEPNRVWLNDGAGNYADSGMELGSENSFAVALGDLDGDGDLDAFVANSGNDRVWINSSAPAEIQSDVDGDGVQDINDPCPADPLDECEQNGSAAEEIGQDEGGSLATPDGQLEIVVEAGDISEDTVISATESVIVDPQVDLSIGTAGGQALALYDLEPDGVTFDNPVTLALELDVSALDPLQRTQLDIYRQEDLDGDGARETFVWLGAACSVTQHGVDTFIASCSVELNHFSTYAMVAPLDSDGDGVLDNFNGYIDACPSEDATGFDVDDNGCIDSFSGLIGLVSALVSEGVIDANMRNSLISKVDNAKSSADRESVCTAVNELRAFQAQVAAQTGKKISAEAANLVTDYADSIISYLLNKLAAGMSC